MLPQFFCRIENGRSIWCKIDFLEDGTKVMSWSPYNIRGKSRNSCYNFRNRRKIECLQLCNRIGKSMGPRYTKHCHRRSTWIFSVFLLLHTNVLCELVSRCSSFFLWTEKSRWRSKRVFRGPLNTGWRVKSVVKIINGPRPAALKLLSFCRSNQKSNR